MDASTTYAEDILRQHLSVIEPYLTSNEVNEVMVNAADDIWVEERGVMRKVDAGLSEEQVDRAITLIASKNGKPNSPLLDARLPGLRIAAARKPIALRGSMLCVRRFAAKRISLDSYVESGAFDVVTQDPLETAAADQEQASLKAPCVMAAPRYEIFSSGSSSGVTTSSSAALPPPERQHFSTLFWTLFRAQTASSRSRTRPSCAWPYPTMLALKPTKRSGSACVTWSGSAFDAGRTGLCLARSAAQKLSISWTL